MEAGFEMVSVPLNTDTSAALASFSARVGVSREAVMSVLIGLSENEHRNKHGAMVLARLLMACQDAMKTGKQDTTVLQAEIDLALGEYEVPTLV